jgi:(S)-3,5-dihydroxyphenylglycine transaminase
MEEKNYTINHRLFGPYLERMNFLNEISIDYPDAVSFGSGRPNKRFFNVKDVVSCFFSFDGEDFNALGQYNKTNGIINESISMLLRNDEAIAALPENIIITDGAQEGMVIAINTLFEPGSDKDVLLVSDPSYIGFVGYAKILGLNIAVIPRDGDSIDLQRLEDTVIHLKSKGKNPKVLYEVPDFHNPTGEYMALEKRKQLIQLAETHNFLIVEDNPYGYFRYDSEKIPTLKALDTYRRVIYLGSFSKTLFPSIRMGWLVVDQQVADPRNNNKPTPLVEAFKKTKSFITVNTSTLLQAIVGRFLQLQDYTMVPYCQPKVAASKKNRDAMLAALSAYFPTSQSWTKDIKWNIPRGGFFLVLDLPFEITDALLKECVQQYSVIFCPMSFFCLDSGKESRQIRLAYSNLSTKKIEQGIARLSAFVKNQICEK